jgi:hypothetical protein
LLAQEDEVEKADLALHRAQLAVERKDIARWKKIFKEAKKRSRIIKLVEINS